MSIALFDGSLGTRIKPLLIICALALSGCAHPIKINPDTAQLKTSGTRVAEKKVGYYISDADRSREVITPGGGGDKVSYSPYKDLEHGFRSVLNGLFPDIALLRSPNDIETITQEKIAYVFVPEFNTTSSSDGLFTWPPTSFTVEIVCKINDDKGNLLSRVKVLGRGDASFTEFQRDFGLAGKRASADALNKLLEELRSESHLR